MLGTKHSAGGAAAVCTSLHVSCLEALETHLLEPATVLESVLEAKKSPSSAVLKLKRCFFSLRWEEE